MQEKMQENGFYIPQQPFRYLPIQYMMVLWGIVTQQYLE